MLARSLFTLERFSLIKTQPWSNWLIGGTVWINEGMLKPSQQNVTLRLEQLYLSDLFSHFNHDGWKPRFQMTETEPGPLAEPCRTFISCGKKLAAESREQKSSLCLTDSSEMKTLIIHGLICLHLSCRDRRRASIIQHAGSFYRICHY